MKTKLFNLTDTLRSNFWFVPALLLTTAWILSLVTLRLDSAFKDQAVALFGYNRGPDGARLLLSTVAGSVIGVAGVSFSITITALSLASSQLGPRLLRTFMRDRGNQLVLGTLLATFLYCLLILRTINGTGNEAFVPHISVVISLVFALISLVMFIYFINHVSSSMQADRIAATADRELEKVINRVFLEQAIRDVPEISLESPYKDITTLQKNSSASIKAAKSGYLQSIDTDTLVSVATRHNVLLSLEHRTGDFVVQGSVLALFSSKKHSEEKLSKEVNHAYLFGFQRTPTHDVEFALNQLVEIAVRALSPGINDPFTAITCINWLGRALCQITERTFPSPYHYDKGHTLRVISQPETFERIADTVFNQIREAAQTNTAVTFHLLKTIANVLAVAKNHKERVVLLRHGERIVQGSQEGLSLEVDRQAVQRFYEEMS